MKPWNTYTHRTTCGSLRSTIGSQLSTGRLFGVGIGQFFIGTCGSLGSALSEVPFACSPFEDDSLTFPLVFWFVFGLPRCCHGELLCLPERILMIRVDISVVLNPVMYANTQ